MGEVVLGEQVHQQRAARGVGEVGVGGIERFALGEVATAAPRHHLVREPLLGGGEMTVEELGRRRDRSQLDEKAVVVHGVNGTRRGGVARDQRAREVTGA